MMSSIASQKSGMLRPRKATTATPWSRAEFFARAEISPAGTAMMSASRNEIAARVKVRGKASPTIRDTLRWLP